MKWHLTEFAPEPEPEHTDELPILSEDAILEFEFDQSAAHKAEVDALETAVETLRETLDLAERRWGALESRLEAQDQAIAEIKGHVGNSPAPLDPAPPDPAPIAIVEPAGDPGQPAAGTVSLDSSAGDSETTLLERIASLEAYIAGRADRWQAMEQDLAARSRRISELEIELQQRIDREQQLEDRLHNESDRANELRDKLRRMHRRLEEAELGLTDQDLDATRQLVGRAIQGTQVWFHPMSESSESSESESVTAPKIFCLTADLPEPFVMSKDAITIGRAPDCDIQIATDFVSRQHATIRRENFDTIIEDRSSTNGVFVNAQRIKRKALTDGDEITIGESRFRFVAGEPLN
jgi:phage shock protein A